MKGTTVVLLLALIGLSYQQVDYATPANSFTDARCTGSSETRFASPIMIQSTKCGSYEDFKLNFAAITTPTPASDPAKGGHRLDYTGGTLTFDGKNYESAYIIYRAAAEHVLYSVESRADIEIQIYFNDEAGAEALAMAFLFKSSDGPDDDEELERARTALNIITTLDGSAFDLDLPAISDAIDKKIARDVFLNFYTYEGSRTFPDCEPITWLVYASEFYTTNAIITAATGAITGTEATTNTLGNTRLFQDAGGFQPARHLCYTGYFKVRMDANYGLWFSIGILLLFFIFTLSMENTPINNVDYKENGWTHHPIYSVWKVGNDIFTKKSRAAMILVTVINSALWNSVFFRVVDNPTAGENVITLALASLGIGWIFTYVLGWFLRKYYIYKHRYEETNDENLDNKAQFYIFIYYFGVFLAIWIGFGFTIWNMNELKSYVDSKPSNLWVAAFFITLALDWLVFDIIVAWFCVRSKRWRNWCKWKGYIYDDLCHDSYLRSIKRE